jgi:DNA-binding winged helix-turn-helix (wHTH) protein
MAEATSERYRVGDLLVDVGAGIVLRDHERVVLPPLTFELLVALVRGHPGFVSRANLIGAVWPGEAVTDQALTHRVALLRHALGDHADVPLYVAGERGWGYRLVAPVRRLEDRPAPAFRRRRRALAAAAAGLVIALGLAVAERPGGDRAAPRPSSPLPERATRAARLCARAEFFWLEGTGEGLRRARSDYAAALALEPGLATAHAGASFAASLAVLEGIVPAAEAVPAAREHASRALALDSRLADAHAAAAVVGLLFGGPPGDGREHLRQAAELDASRPPVLVARVLHLQAQGRLAESLMCLEAAASEPAALLAWLEGRSLQMQGRRPEAIAAYERALSLEPDLVAARRGLDEVRPAAPTPRP